MRGAGGDQHGLAGQILRDTQPLQSGSDNLLRFGQPSRAHHAASKIAAARLDNMHPTSAQDFQIRLRGRMLPHVHVHRWCDDDRRGSRQIQSAEEIVGDALGEFCQCVGGGGRDQKAVQRLRHRDMFDR